jgi:hypothetical protein
LSLERILADYSLDHSQLIKRRSAGDGFLSNRALSRIVRLTIETNILTSKLALNSACKIHCMRF